jgi:hypothetical protein
LKRSWSVDVENGLSWAIRTSAAQVMCKRRAIVKLAVWLSITKSRESTRPRCVQVECGTPLESSQGELQFFFRPHPDWRFEQEVMSCQSPRSLNRDNFKTPTWESRDKKPFGCGPLWSGAKYTIWGKVVASFEFKLWSIKRVQSCPWFVLTPRVLQNVI